MFCGLVGGSALHLQSLVSLFSCCPLKGLLESRRPRKRLLGELWKLFFGWSVGGSWGGGKLKEGGGVGFDL